MDCVHYICSRDISLNHSRISQSPSPQLSSNAAATTTTTHPPDKAPLNRSYTFVIRLISSTSYRPPHHARRQRRRLDQRRGRDPQGLRLEIRSQPMATRLLLACAQIRKAMQSPLVRMAGSEYPQGRVVARRGREAATLGQVDANAMADYRAHRWENRHTVLGSL